jgi:hypothetical protein
LLDFVSRFRLLHFVSIFFVLLPFFSIFVAVARMNGNVESPIGTGFVPNLDNRQERPEDAGTGLGGSWRLFVMDVGFQVPAIDIVAFDSVGSDSRIPRDWSDRRHQENSTILAVTRYIHRYSIATIDNGLAVATDEGRGSGKRSTCPYDLPIYPESRGFVGPQPNSQSGDSRHRSSQFTSAMGFARSNRYQGTLPPGFLGLNVMTHHVFLKNFLYTS